MRGWGEIVRKISDSYLAKVRSPVLTHPRKIPSSGTVNNLFSRALILKNRGANSAGKAPPKTTLRPISEALSKGGGGYPRREFVTLITSKNLVAALLLRGA